MAASRFRPPVWTRLAYLVCLVVAVVISVELLQDALPRYIPKNWVEAHEGDGLMDWKAARLALQHRSPYTPQGLRDVGLPSFGHPPTTSFWFLPVAEFSKATAAAALNLSFWLALVVHVFLVLRELKYPAPVAGTALVCAAALSTKWLLYHWEAIQLSEHIAFTIVLAWYFLRRGQQTRAGIALGAAASLKLFPGLLIVFLLLARKWKAFIAASTTFLAITVVMLRLFSWDAWLLFFKQQGPIADFWVGFTRNASVHGIATRLVTPLCTGKSLPTPLSTAGAIVASVLLLAMAIWLCRRPLKRAESEYRAIDLPFALFTLLSVFLNVWAWEHYYVLLIHPMLVLAREFWDYFRVRLRCWSDEQCSHWALVRALLIVSTSLASWLFVVKLLSLNLWSEEPIVSVWTATRGDWAHRHLHLVEVANWLPWAIGLVLCLIWLRLAGHGPTDQQPTAASD